jgi:hypothetical protein
MSVPGIAARCVLFGTLFASVASCQQLPRPAARLSDIREVTRYLGTYPCANGLLKSQAVLSALKGAMGQDFQKYRQHISLSGCGKLELRDGWAFADISQSHVGGYTSYVFIRPTDGEAYVFWLKSAVGNKDWEIYGEKPVPQSILHTVESELNEGWGHVAGFRFDGQNLVIALKQP